MSSSTIWDVDPPSLTRAEERLASAKAATEIQERVKWLSLAGIDIAAIEERAASLRAKLNLLSYPNVSQA